jgi:hypothetical protein
MFFFCFFLLIQCETVKFNVTSNLFLNKSEGIFINSQRTKLHRRPHSI